MVCRSPNAECIGDRMAAGPCIGKDDGLSPEPLRRGALILFGGHLLDGGNFCLRSRKRRYRSRPTGRSAYWTRLQFSFLASVWRADSRRKVQELGLRSEVFQAAIMPSRRAAVCIFEHLHLVDYDGRNICHPLPAADHVVNTFVGTNNDW